MASPFSLSFLFHLVILLFSVSCACVAGFYVHPLLLPILIDSVPRFRSALRAQLTTPFLFILLNLLVGALYVTSRMMPQSTRRGQQEDAETNTKVNEGSNLAKKTPGDVLSDDAEMSGNLSCLNADNDKAGRLEMQKRNAKNRSRRLARSKSDGVVSIAAVGKSPMELRAVGPHLKKAGTFESAWRRRRVKPVVVVVDPPEDGQVAEEEVDKKAEDFIGRFYQRVKLQHLDSLEMAAAN